MWSILHHVSFLGIVRIIELKIIKLSTSIISYISISNQPLVVILKLHCIVIIRTCRFVWHCLKISHRLLPVVLKVVNLLNVGVDGVVRLFVLYHWSLFLNVALIVGGVLFPKVIPQSSSWITSVSSGRIHLLIKLDIGSTSIRLCMNKRFFILVSWVHIGIHLGVQWALLKELTCGEAGFLITTRIILNSRSK